MVNTGLVAIYLMASFDSYFWPTWPMLGWAIGLGTHAVSVYTNSENVRERLIDEALEKLRRTRGGRYLPLKAAGRFSTKAMIPSRASAVRDASPCA